MKHMIDMEKTLASYSWDTLPDPILKQAKLLNMSDHFLSETYQVPIKEVRQKWQSLGLQPGYKLVDTCAAEFEAETPYYYSTWSGEDEAETDQQPKILVIGSGPIRIGQGIEFDYCSVQAALAVQKHGYEVIVINNNPETVSTDYSIADRLYFDPLALEDILNVVEKEHVKGVLIQFGGQTAINLAKDLEEAGVPILGTSTQAIDTLEDRKQFYELLESLDIPHIIGETAHSIDGLRQAAQKLGYPILVRPSYVIGGQSMTIFYHEGDLEQFIKREVQMSERSWPLLIDRYVPGLECEVDVISDGKDILIPGIFEHIEKAGVHSGDSTAVFPSVSLSEAVKQTIVKDAESICRAANIRGLMNIQFVVVGEAVYVLEVNPRASRTVPIISKITGVPMVEQAVQIQLGDSLEGDKGLLQPPSFYAVKAPVFSTKKLSEVDPVLGPEMKSTGEFLAMGDTFEESIAKAFLGHDNPFIYREEQPLVFCTVTDREKSEAALPIGTLQASGFKIYATKDTAGFLSKNGLNPCGVIESLDDLQSLMESEKLAGVINIPTLGRKKGTFGFGLRQLTERYQIPLFTSLDTVKAAVKAAQDKRELKTLSLEDYRKAKSMPQGVDA